jgi:hypothetical protein
MEDDGKGYRGTELKVLSGSIVPKGKETYVRWLNLEQFHCVS